jgi:hypothetical protein
MAFIVEHFGNPPYQGDDDCPEGLGTMLRANFTASLPPAERVRLLKPENAPEFQKLYVESARGPNGTDICTHYDRFDRPATRTVQGKTAYGLNLDGNDGSSTDAAGCSHDNFTSPAGESGVDNQTWRALGCLKIWRGTKEAPPQTAQVFNQSLANGENGQVIVIKGIDSWASDHDVQVIYGNTRDRALLAADGRFERGASYVMSETPGGPNVLRGRIVNGLIEISAPELRLRQVFHLGRGLRGEDLRGARGKLDLRRIRMRLSIQPDGSLTGLIGGYQSIEDSMFMLTIGGLGAATTADFDCPVIYATYRRMADGDRDPKTNRCRTISTAYQIKAVPAFVTQLESMPRKSERAERSGRAPSGS